LAERLRAEGEEELAEQLEGCNQPMRLVCVNCGQVHPCKTACKKRWCPVCARRLAAKMAARYEGLVAEMRWPIFATFTVKNYPDDARGFVRELRRAFQKLRRLRWWKRAVRGGIVSVEVTNIGNGWHPHLHAVLDSDWLSVTVPPPRRGVSSDSVRHACTRSAREVSEQWSLCVGRPGNVKCKRAYGADSEGRDSIAREVLKYSVKGSDLVECEDSPAILIRELLGTRLVTSFGTCYGRLTEFDKPKAVMTCETCHDSNSFLPESEWDRMCRGG
jgi:hypothetical protein